MVEMLCKYTTKHLLACMFIYSKANQQEDDLLFMLCCRLLLYKTRHKQDAFSIIFDNSYEKVNK